MYTIGSRPKVDKIFEKLARKNPKQLEIITKKLQQIIQNPQKFKPLHFPLAGMRRVHIDKSFVLTYSIDEKNKVVIIEDYDHHDKIYRNWIDYPD